MKKLLTFFLTALLAFAVGWAEPSTATYTVTAYNNGTLTGAPSEVSASISTTASQMLNGGSQLTNGKNFKLTLSGFTSSYKLTGISLNYCTNASSGAGTFTATLGSNQIGSYSITKVSSNGKTPRDADLSISEIPFDGSDLELNVTATANSVYVISFTITYEENSGPQPAEPNWYRKVTSVNDLVVGNKYIFVYENGSSSAAMGAISSGYGTGVTGLDVTNNKINIGGEDVIEFTLGGSSDAWTFQNSADNRYLGTQSATSDKFVTSASLGSYSDLKWTINSDNGRIRNNLSSRYIRCNSSNSFGLFNSGNYACLYVQDLEVCAAPQFSPDGGSSTTGSLDVIITSATEGATIYYTTDNTDPVVSRSSIANGGTVTLTESCTLKAMAVKSGMDNSPIATSQSYTITSGGGTPSSSTIYTKVTDPNLVPGLKYILVYGTVGMGTYSSGKGVAITGLTTLPNNKVDINGKDVIVFTAGGTVNAYTFIANNNYLAYNSSTNLKESTTLDDKARWTLVGNSSDGYYLINNGTNTRGVIYNGTQFGAYATSNLGNSYYPAYLYVQEEQSTDPTLSVSNNNLSISAPYDQNSGTSTFTVTGANLGNNNVTVSVSGADFSVSPTSITPDANGAVNAETITVTYYGTSTSPVTGTVTVACGDLSETVTVTAQKELPPPASITVNPSTLTINDSGMGNTFTVEGSNLGSDNVGVTQTNNNFTPTLSATTGTTYDGGSYRGFTPVGGEVNGTVAMSYTGRELYANNTVTLGNNTGASATVAVNYIADLYIVTDNGVTGDWHFDGTFGVPMTYNNGIYSAAFTVNNPNTYILFARKTGEGVTWNTRYVFGPNSSGDWDLPSSGNGGGSIDLNDDDPIKIQGTGTYIVTIDANTGTFSIVKKTIGADDFILVTKTNDVTANDDYVLVYDEAYAMGTTLSSSNGGYYNEVTSGFTVDNNIVSLVSR